MKLHTLETEDETIAEDYGWSAAEMLTLSFARPSSFHVEARYGGQGCSPRGYQMNTEARQRVLGSNPLLRVPLSSLFRPFLPLPPPPFLLLSAPSSDAHPPTQLLRPRLLAIIP